MKRVNLSKKLSLKSKPPRKTKQEFARNAQDIINTYLRYSSDVNYSFFLNKLVLGLCENTEYSVLNDLIKDLQRLKGKRKFEESEDELLI